MMIEKPFNWSVFVKVKFLSNFKQNALPLPPLLFCFTPSEMRCVDLTRLNTLEATLMIRGLEFKLTIILLSECVIHDQEMVSGFYNLKIPQKISYLNAP